MPCSFSLPGFIHISPVLFPLMETRYRVTKDSCSRKSSKEHVHQTHLVLLLSHVPLFTGSSNYFPLKSYCCLGSAAAIAIYLTRS